MFFGPSGSGKSTLTALLAANGFEFVADDLVPLQGENHHIYSSPKAISVKKPIPASILKFWPALKNKKNHYKGKQPLTYLNLDSSEIKPMPCKYLILVRYSEHYKTKLQQLDFKQGLEILIPEAWLSPEEQHANSFLRWLETVTFYSLEYSNYKDVIPLIESLSQATND